VFLKKNLQNTRKIEDTIKHCGRARMTYSETNRELTKRISIAIVDFSADRNIARTPTQASSIL
jgi:hypothetical protein